MKTCNVGKSPVYEAGDERYGSSLGGYVTSGTESKRRCRAEGMGGIQLLELAALELEAAPAPEACCDWSCAEVIASPSCR